MRKQEEVGQEVTETQQQVKPKTKFMRGENDYGATGGKNISKKEVKMMINQAKTKSERKAIVSLARDRFFPIHNKKKKVKE